MPRILYLQYNNPAAYPPIEYSSQILAERGFQVHLLGLGSRDTKDLRLPETPGITLELIPPAQGAFLRRLNHPRFLLRSLSRILSARPDWVYVSDYMAAPAGWIAKRLLGRRVLYHEHDAPARSVESSGLHRRVVRLRDTLVRCADLVVVPQLQRAEKLREITRTTSPIYCVWNCPRPSEAGNPTPRRRGTDETLGIYYHGSINLNRTPLSLVEGCRRSGVPVRLRIVGYETVGSRGSITQLRAAAERSDGQVELDIVGPKPRHELRNWMGGMHVGWINCLKTEEDSNLTDLFGASNKAFDYLAAGMPLIVPADPTWREAIEDAGYGLTCDAADPESIARAIRWYHDNPDRAASMGQAGRLIIQAAWNYDQQFSPLLVRLSGN